MAFVGQENGQFKVAFFVYLVGFLDLFGVSMLVPLLSRHARDLGASPTTAGLIGSLYGGLQLFSSPFIGKWSDISGRRHVLLLCLLLSSIGYFLLGLSSTVLLFCMARIFAGIFKHTQDMLRGYFIDAMDATDHSQVLGHLNAVSQIGFIIGPLAGGHLTELPDGFSKVAFITTGTFLLIIGIVYFFIPELHRLKEINSCQPHISNSSKLFTPYKIMQDFKKIKWNNLWDIFLIRFCLGFAVMVFRSNLGLMLDYRFGLSAKATGYVTSFSAMIGTTSGFFVGNVAQLYKDDNKLMYHASLVQFVSMVVMFLAPSAGVLIICLVPLSVMNAILRVVVTNLTVQRGHGHETGTLLGFGASVLSMGRMLSPTIGGIAQELHICGPAAVGAVFAFAAVLIITVVPQNEIRKRKFETNIQVHKNN